MWCRYPPLKVNCQSCVRRCGDPERGEGPGQCVWVESPPGCVVGTNVHATDLMTKPLPKLKIQQLRKLMRSKLVEHSCASRNANSWELDGGADRYDCCRREAVGSQWQSQPRCPRARVDSRYRDRHSARLLRFPDSFSGHTVVSRSSLVLSVFFLLSFVPLFMAQ